ncbi:MAG: c-type cytochrome [Acidobacteriota bacterium]|nr:c-type cytochrome [Acidobacteriota bacterium]
MERKLPPIFFALSIGALGMILGVAWRSAHPQWKDYQAEYLRLEAVGEPNAAAKNAVLSTPETVQQILLPGLQRVDRCTTCHMGVEDPTMKSAAQPYTYHSGLQPHTPAKFGCTICHGGQGLATDKDAAHGNIEFWSEPLLPKEYIRASCGRCHKEGEVPGVPELAEGRVLFETRGCRGCHKLNGVGGSIGPDLTEEGAQRRNPRWLEQHFLKPASVSPNSAMPNFNFTREQARALSYYMLSLTNEQMGAYYASERVIPSASYGKQLFVEKNCIACHALGGVGSKNGVELTGVTSRHSPGWLDEQLVNPTLVAPGTDMPTYDLDTNSRKALVTFLASASADDARAILAGRPKGLNPEEEAIEAGHQDFIRFGCVGCHGTELQGGVPNPNSQSGQVPSLLHLSDDYTQPEVLHIIREGKMPPVANPHLPTPPLYMPQWKSVMSEEDINRILQFLWSKQPKKTESW